jgi:hypothetical protein
MQIFDYSGNNDESKIITTKIQSRHRSNKEFRVYVQYIPTSEIEKFEAIQSWYCECKNGSRTLGCCCHIASLLYYLSFARHQENNLHKPAQFLSDIFPSSLKNESFTQSDAKKTKKRNKKNQDKSDFNSDYSTSENEKSEDDDFEKNNKQMKLSNSVQIISEPKPLSSKDKLYLNSPKWGGKIVSLSYLKESNKYKNLIITNTCSIDYMLLGIWLSTKLSEKVFTKLKNTIIKLFI